MRTRTAFLDEDLGELTAPPGSASWSRAVRAEIQRGLKDHEFAATELESWVSLLRAHDGFRQLMDAARDPFPTFEAFCVAPQPHGLGYDPTAINAIIRERKTVQERASARVQSAAADTTGKVLPRGRPSAEKIGNLPISGQDHRATRNGISPRTQRKLDYLANEAAALLEEVRAGRLSPDAAYRQARELPPRCNHDATIAGFVNAIRAHLSPEQISELIAALEGLES